MKGKAWKYGDNVNTDEILPARHLNVSDPKELAKHCMEDIDLDFVKKIQPGDVIIAGDNFGCGSSREHAPIAIKECKIYCVIAGSFARIFFRNAINIGLPIIEHPEAAKEIQAGESIEVDLAGSKIRNLTTGKTYTIAPFAPEMLAIIEAGGLMPFIKATLGNS